LVTVWAACATAAAAGLRVLTTAGTDVTIDGGLVTTL
jgi:hypothetical protein